MRSTLLYLSTAGWARQFTTHFPPATRATRRFVAGDTIEEAISASKALNRKNLLVSLDCLGENVSNQAEAKAVADHYVQLIEAIEKAQVKASCSLKLTQLGLDLSEALCMENMRRILDRAKAAGLEITIDMESSEYTDKTLNIFHALHSDGGYENLGTVIQSYLYRSEKDMQTLAEEGATIRLCKGAYKEPAEVAFPKKSDVDENYIKLAKAFMSAQNRAKGALLQLATHDLNIIAEMENFVKQQNIPAEQFEFQMLYGIRSGTQEELAAKGYQVRVYVPYGTEWYPYFMRRLAERPANVWFVAKNLFSR